MRRRSAVPEPVAISSRWVPQHVVRIDTVAGTFEEVNGPCDRDDEARIQQALLAAPVVRLRDILFDLAKDAI